MAASSPHSPLGGFGREDETRAPTKLLGDCHVIDSQCCRLTVSLLAMTGVIENFESYMPTRTDVIDFWKEK